MPRLPEGTEVRTDDHTDNGATTVTLPTANPDDLNRLLAHVQWLERPLLSVDRAQPSLEEIFIRLVGDAA
jgi:hypothetical protein